VSRKLITTYHAPPTVLATNRRGEIAAILTDDGPFLSAELHCTLTDLAERVARVQATTVALVILAEGKRRADRDTLRKLQGEFAACGTGIVSVLLEHGVSAADGLVTDVTRYFADYAGALQSAIEGDFAALEHTVATADNGIASSALRHLAQVPSRGHRLVDERTQVLGRITASVREPGQSWVLTARKVAARLRELDEAEYPWALQDAAMLQEFVRHNDRDRCRELLRYAYDRHQRRRAVRRSAQ